jgi:hypothetical protein
VAGSRRRSQPGAGWTTAPAGLTAGLTCSPPPASRKIQLTAAGGSPSLLLGVVVLINSPPTFGRAGGGNNQRPTGLDFETDPPGRGLSVNVPWLKKVAPKGAVYIDFIDQEASARWIPVEPSGRTGPFLEAAGRRLTHCVLHDPYRRSVSRDRVGRAAGRRTRYTCGEDHDAARDLGCGPTDGKPTRST